MSVNIDRQTKQIMATMEILSEELVKEAIVGALEGGSNYWYFLPDTSRLAVRYKVPQSENEYLSEAVGEAVYKGANVIFRDAEDTNEVLGTLSKESIDSGLYRMLNDGRTELEDIRSGNADAETYDVLFQYFVLGEIVFG
jgi:hypothetical protein